MMAMPWIVRRRKGRGKTSVAEAMEGAAAGIMEVVVASGVRVADVGRSHRRDVAVVVVGRETDIELLLS